jgi:hypothetical protein
MQAPPTNDAALQVLTNPSLFRQVVSWSAGWPGLLVYKLVPSLSPDAVDPCTGASTDGTPLQADGTILRTPLVLRRADARILEAAARARWWNADGKLVGFDLEEPALTLRSGNALVARLIFERTKRRDITADEFYRCWSAAVTNCHGCCDILDIVNEFVPRGTFSFSSDYLIRIDRVAVARWFVEHFGPTCLPRNLIIKALRMEYLGLYYFLLRKTRGQVSTTLLIDSLVQDPRKQAICSLLNKCVDGTIKFYGNQLLSLIAKTDDKELIEQVLADWSSQCSEGAVDEATEALARLNEGNQDRGPGGAVEQTMFHPTREDWRVPDPAAGAANHASFFSCIWLCNGW